MHFNRALSAAVILALAGISSPSFAIPSRLASPSVELNRSEVQQTCHHYRWSSQRKCTSTKALRSSVRPRLHYPQRYYGGRPHYEYAYPYYYGYRYPYFARHGFYPYPWYRRPYWWY